MAVIYSKFYFTINFRQPLFLDYEKRKSIDCKAYHVINILKIKSKLNTERTTSVTSFFK